MRVLPAMLLVLLAVIHYSACEDSRRGDAWTRLGRELLIRAKLAGIIGTGSEATADESESSEEDREHMIKTDAAEDIFVGSQNDVGPQSTTDSSASEDTTDERTENVADKDGEKTPEEAEEEVQDSAKNYDSSGDAGEGDDDEYDDDEYDDDNEDDDDGEKNTTDNEKSNEDNEDSENTAGDDEDENQTEGEENTDNKSANKEDETSDKFAQQLISESGDGENADTRTIETSGSGSGSDVQSNKQDETGSSGSGQQENVEERANVAYSEETSGSGSEPSNGTSIIVKAAGSGQQISEDVAASKRSKIKSSSEENAEDDAVNSAAIRKGVESLSRLLSPVASNYAFTLYSGSAMASDEDDKDKESEGEDESGGQETADQPEVKVKQCKQVCELPMTFHECAVPRCDMKIGTIKDLCFWLCKHQKEVCRQECE